MARRPYPLQWPDGWKRATWRKSPQFTTAFAKDRDSVIRQLRKRGGSSIVITSNLATNSKGLPYAGAASDPGIAVWWIEGGKERVLACDTWKRAAENLSAIDRTLTALRALDRHGCTQVIEKTFASFAALPPAGGTSTEAMPAPAPVDWRAVLGTTFGPWPDELEPDELLALAKARHRKLIAIAHPDRGGDQGIASRLNEALEAAESELGG